MASGRDPLDLSGVDLTRIEARSSDMRRSRISDCRLNASIMDGSSFVRASFENCAFASASLDRTVWNKATIERCSFPDAVIRASEFADTQVRRSSFERARFDSSQWGSAKVWSTDFTGVGFPNASLDRVSFTNCDFSDADFSARKHGSEAGTRLSKVTFERCDLRWTRWHGTSLTDVLLVNCKVFGISGEIRLEGAWISRGSDGSPAGDGSVSWTSDRLGKALGVTYPEVDPGEAAELERDEPASLFLSTLKWQRRLELKVDATADAHIEYVRIDCVERPGAGTRFEVEGRVWATDGATPNTEYRHSDVTERQLGNLLREWARLGGKIW